MLPDYKDVIQRAGAPDWWDEVGCPRYGPFQPNRCRVYNDVIGFYLIGCQACDKKFKVAMGYGPTDKVMGRRPRLEFPRPAEGYAGLHYGDPPPHGDCSGATMNCEELKVLEFWARDLRSISWKRLSWCEGKIRDNYFNERGQQRDFTQVKSD